MILSEKERAADKPAVKAVKGMQEISIKGKQAFDEYIFVAPGSDYGRAMWSDIERLRNATLLESALTKTNKLIETAHHLHFSFRINRKVYVPFQGIWKPLYSLNGARLDDDKKYCVIYTDVSACRTDYDYLCSLGKKKNVTLVLVMVNTMKQRREVILKRLGCFSYIFSFDKGDAKRYGFIYHPTNYSAAAVSGGEKTLYDLFFVGVSKGRAESLGRIYEQLSAKNVRCEFYISGVKKNEKRVEGIHYNKWLTYSEVLEKVKSSNCILEVMEQDQEGFTLRTMEAVCYNKRLLTNNSCVISSPFYKSGFIKTFADTADIDTAFVTDRSEVDYHYDNEFSPVHLLEHINDIVLSGET